MCSKSTWKNHDDEEAKVIINASIYIKSIRILFNNKISMENMKSFKYWGKILSSFHIFHSIYLLNFFRIAKDKSKWNWKFALNTIVNTFFMAARWYKVSNIYHVEYSVLYSTKRENKRHIRQNEERKKKSDELCRRVRW